YQLSALRTCPIGKWSGWAEARGVDNILMAQWLYGLTKDADLLKLSVLLQQQSFPWSQWFGGRDWVIHAAAYQDSAGWMQRHGVNVAMGLKDPAVQYQRTGDPLYLR